MSLVRPLLDRLAAIDLRPVAVQEAEIREELEFHLEMRTLENLDRGMPLEDARADARRRFGDFEKSFTACRRQRIGPRLVLQRLQAALLCVLLAAVVSLSVALVRSQAANQSAMDELSATIESLRQNQAPPATPPVDREKLVPYRQWPVAQPSIAAPPVILDAGSTEYFPAADCSTAEPWCDWSAIDTSSE